MGNSTSINITLPIASVPAAPTQPVTMGNVIMQPTTVSLSFTVTGLSTTEVRSLSFHVNEY